MIDLAALAKQAPEYDLRDLLEAGVHFGHQSRRWHPKMKPWIYTEKDGVHIFDLAKTATQLQHAYNYAYDLGKNNKTLIVVGTKKQAREIVREKATDAGAMYITSRWLGGLLTNWEQVSRSLNGMIQIETGLQEGKYDRYTKHERVLLDKKASRLKRFFDGIRGIKAKPDALFIIDPSREKNVVLEAVKMNVPIMAIVDTNTNPTDIDLVIPGNDDAVSSLEYLISAVLAGYKAGKNNK